ncbi:unnamed protein product (mitochondrion) [Plasmodiophora brassicae]|uniref:Uncharacterized protein n=1 Tax=Plasmodiophora brassicae TaxID=37360 RepID=A0A3P3Y0L0_PLABS|nr:unnamed protein product [Plasmodiophora brassicae]
MWDPSARRMRCHTFAATMPEQGRVKSADEGPERVRKRSRRRRVKHREIRFGLRELFAISFRLLCGCIQFVVAMSVLIAVSVVWAILFASSTPDDIRGVRLGSVGPLTREQQLQAMTAWSEMAQMMVSTLVYKYMTGEEIRICLNNLLWRTQLPTFTSIDVLEFLPVHKLSRAHLSKVHPLVLIATNVADGNNERFQFDVSGAFPFFNASLSLFGIREQVSDGLSLAGRIALQIPDDMYESTLKILNVRSAKSVATGRNIMFFRKWLLRYSPPIYLIWADGPEEARLGVIEREIETVEDERYDESQWIANTRLKSDRPVPVRSLGSTVPEPFRRHKAPPNALDVPVKICNLSDKQLEKGSTVWTRFAQRLLYTFTLNPSIQTTLRTTLENACNSMSGPIRLRILGMDLGVHSVHDAPQFEMSSQGQHREAFTYKAFMYINWEKLKVKMAVDGIMNSSSVVFDITNFRLSGPVTFRIIHPLLVEVDFITMSFDLPPIFDFDLQIDLSRSHLFGAMLTDTRGALVMLFETHLTKAFVTNIPWLVDRGDIQFSSDAAQHVYRSYPYLYPIASLFVDDRR